MYSIQANRLHATLRTVAELGSIDGAPGVSRLAGSPAEKATRTWLLETCKARGLTAYQDAANNVVCRYGPEGTPVVTGSHLDSVPHGGNLDGALGVLAGLEALTVIAESDVSLARPVELIAFFDEEGRFGSMIGSKALAGQLSADEVAAAHDETGRLLTDVLREDGHEAADLLAVRRHADSVHAFLELHIEQGPVLEAENCVIGCVEHITGIIRWRARFQGQANHAGTTPMHLRQDAFLGVVRFQQALEAICGQEDDGNTRYTIGRVVLSPNYVGVVPQEAAFTLDLRTPQADRLTELNETLQRCAIDIAEELGLQFEVEVHGQHAPTPCAPHLVNLVERMAQKAGFTHKRLLSGALHDAATMAHLGPTGMIFVPSAGGVSHSSTEHTDPRDIEMGAHILLNSLIELAQES